MRTLLAVQSQDFLGAKWGLGQRTKRASDASIERAYDEGRILRTHVMRPTWHFVLPDDIRWLLDLTAPRVRAILAPYDRKLEIDAALRRRSAKLLAKALRDGQYRTRKEISLIYADGGIEATGQRLGHIVSHAELDGLICSGPMRGKQHTYGLLDERASGSRRILGDEALAELALRFFSGHGPATVKDCAWWSGLTQADVRAGIASVGNGLTRESIARTEYYFAPDAGRLSMQGRLVHLLPNYDEYLIAYRDESQSLARGRVPIRSDALAEHFVMLDGRIVGGWRRTVTKNGFHARVLLFGSHDAEFVEAVHDEFARFSSFLAKPVSVEFRRA